MKKYTLFPDKYIGTLRLALPTESLILSGRAIPNKKEFITPSNVKEDFEFVDQPIVVENVLWERFVSESLTGIKIPIGIMDYPYKADKTIEYHLTDNDGNVLPYFVLGRRIKNFFGKSEIEFLTDYDKTAVNVFKLSPLCHNLGYIDAHRDDTWGYDKYLAELTERFDSYEKRLEKILETCGNYTDDSQGKRGRHFLRR